LQLLSQEDEVPITVLTVGNYFGELSLLKNITRAANVIAETEVECFTMSRANFEQLLGPLKELIGEGAQQRTKEMASRMRANMQFEDLVTAREMISGFFGHCRLVEDGQTGEVYLMQVKHKADIVKEKQQVAALNEKKVTMSCEHEFIADQLGTFKNDICLFCLMELAQIQGGQLSEYLGHLKNKVLSSDDARFYAASMLLALQHVHKKGFVHRNLMPENVLLGSDGFPKLAGFSLTKKVSERTYTVCGTPEYLAPEMISAKGCKSLFLACPPTPLTTTDYH
jgi:CRP-like cAMP-binding protein